MYIPSYFREEDRAEIVSFLKSRSFANLVTAGPGGLVCTPLPFLLDEAEGEHGVLYAHLARANDHWKRAVEHEALVIFEGADAYISPNWYESKKRDGMSVPTWNYVTVQVYGPVEFFHEEERLLEVVSRLTDRHESGRPQPWAVSDAPEEFIRAQLRGIVGVRIPITKIDAKRKLSQNRNAADKAGVVEGLAQGSERDRELAALIKP
ncbi:FMN-binding negative transcriptional regulator [Terriglobus tenax]|uniref:FMN-binding negative transcriptional regulator n=1 Tax=Terriglobus tenax TaxID=1111115 RepID=UPI0021DF8165|nr:FMN-binding negative transcriptional regulator [Terriglobus tenax]